VPRPYETTRPRTPRPRPNCKRRSQCVEGSAQSSTAAQLPERSACSTDHNTSAGVAACDKHVPELETAPMSAGARECRAAPLDDHPFALAQLRERRHEQRKLAGRDVDQDLGEQAISQPPPGSTASRSLQPVGMPAAGRCAHPARCADREGGSRASRAWDRGSEAPTLRSLLSFSV
jgi:hypothetical protein